MQKVE